MNSGIVFFDLETTNLEGNFGRVICGCFLPIEDDEPLIISETEKKYKGRRLGDDSRVVRACKDILNECWVWVSWNGKLFDVPYLNSRLRFHEIAPLEKRMHLDLMYYARGQFIRLHNSKLDTVAQAFGLDHQKVHLTPDEHVQARVGHKESVEKLVEHCVADVKILRDAWMILKPFVRNIHY